MLRKLEPNVTQCSTSALCNLLWALGRMAGVASGTIKAKRQRQVDGDWIRTPVGSQLLAIACAATTELMRRNLKLHELAAAATAVAAHADHVSELPAAPLAALRRACTAAVASKGLPSADLAHVAGVAARLRWQDAELTDALASDMQARASSWPSEVSVYGCAAVLKSLRVWACAQSYWSGTGLGPSPWPFGGMQLSTLFMSLAFWAQCMTAARRMVWAPLCQVHGLTICRRLPALPAGVHPVCLVARQPCPRPLRSAVRVTGTLVCCQGEALVPSRADSIPCQSVRLHAFQELLSVRLVVFFEMPVTAQPNMLQFTAQQLSHTHLHRNMHAYATCTRTRADHAPRAQPRLRGSLWC